MSATTVTCTRLPEETFSDKHVIKDAEVGDCSTTADVIYEQSVTDKTSFTVPILDSLPHLEAWCPPSPFTTPSTTPSPTQEYFTTPIRWTNEDLIYLLTILLPTPLLANQLHFSPPLHALPFTSTTPTQLKLYQRIPPTPAPPSAYSKHLPIGTGRPLTRTILFASSTLSSTAPSLRRSLASSLLSDIDLVTSLYDRYNVLSTLYSLSAPELEGMYRGMIEMLGVSEREWRERYEQLEGEVDGTCGVEARCEVYWLGVGRGEVEEWVDVVQGAIKMGDELDGERTGWAEVYDEAAQFLFAAVEELEIGCE